MTDPVAVDPAHFLDFVCKPGVVVLFVSVHPVHAFCESFEARLAEHAVDGVEFGSIKILDLVLWATPALPFLRQSLAECGVSNVFGVAPGYWLFQSGRLLAWDPGLPRAADAQPINPSVLSTLFLGGVTRSWVVIAQALHLATEASIAERVALRFAAAVNGNAHEAPRAAGPSAAVSELLRAHAVLGVPPSATDREVEAAWRALRLKHHPDLAASDRGEFERRNKVSAEINHARDVILAHRAAWRRRAA